MAKNDKQPADRSMVRKYKHFEELVDCLASGWSTTAVREYMIERYGAEGVPSAISMNKWRDKHLQTPNRVSPHSVIQQKLKGVQFKVDVIGHLSRLVAMCEERLGRGLEQEDTFGGMPLAVNDGVIQTYLHAIAQYVKVAQDLGLMKAPLSLPGRPNPGGTSRPIRG